MALNELTFMVTRDNITKKILYLISRDEFLEYSINMKRYIDDCNVSGAELSLSWQKFKEISELDKTKIRDEDSINKLKMDIKISLKSGMIRNYFNELLK
jgi:hypothetical protein